MSEDLIDHYKSELEKLKKENISLRQDRTGKLKAAEQQLQEAQGEIEKLRKENGSLSKKVETLPGETPRAKLIASRARSAREITKRNSQTSPRN